MFLRGWKSVSPVETALRPFLAVLYLRRNVPIIREHDKSHTYDLWRLPAPDQEQRRRNLPFQFRRLHADKTGRANRCARKWLCRNTGGRGQISFRPDISRPAL